MEERRVFWDNHGCCYGYVRFQIPKVMALFPGIILKDIKILLACWDMCYPF